MIFLNYQFFFCFGKEEFGLRSPTQTQTLDPSPMYSSSVPTSGVSSLDSYSKDSYSSHFLADSKDSRVSGLEYESGTRYKWSWLKLKNLKQIKDFFAISSFFRDFFGRLRRPEKIKNKNKVLTPLKILTKIENNFFALCGGILRLLFFKKSLFWGQRQKFIC